MHSAVRPVAIGFLLGLLTLIFGIGWVVYLEANHDAIHKRLEESGKAALSAKFVSAPGEHDAHAGHARGSAVHEHGNHGGYGASVEDAEAMDKSHHGDRLMESAHRRLTRGHLHAMGLGLVAISVSLVLLLLEMPSRAKTIASACIGVGAFFYPFSWILMGFRTTALGTEGAEHSVLPIVAISVPLVLAGLFITFFYLLTAVFSRR